MKTNRPLITLFATALLTVSLVACGAPEFQEDSSASVDRHITISDGRVGAIAVDRRVAWVDANGGIELEGQQLSLDEAQRARSSDYHVQALALHDQALQVARQGVNVASTAVSEVVSGLASGNPDQIGKNIDLEARQIEEQVQKMCGQLARLKESQDAVSEAVPAFTAYATIDASTAENCGSGDTSRKRG